MAIAFVNSAYGSESASATTVSAEITPGAGSSKILVVFLTWDRDRGSGTIAPSFVIKDGDSDNPLNEVGSGVVNNDEEIRAYSLLIASSTETMSIEAKFNGLTPNEASIMVLCYSGVGSEASANASNTGNGNAVTITSAAKGANDWFIAAAVHEAGGLVPYTPNNGTERIDDETGSATGSDHSFWAGDRNGTSSGSLGATRSAGSRDWAMKGVTVAPGTQVNIVELAGSGSNSSKGVGTLKRKRRLVGSGASGGNASKGLANLRKIIDLAGQYWTITQAWRYDFGERLSGAIGFGTQVYTLGQVWYLEFFGRNDESWAAPSTYRQLVMGFNNTFHLYIQTSGQIQIWWNDGTASKNLNIIYSGMPGAGVDYGIRVRIWNDPATNKAIAELFETYDGRKWRLATTSAVGSFPFAPRGDVAWNAGQVGYADSNHGYDGDAYMAASGIEGGVGWAVDFTNATKWPSGSLPRTVDGVSWNESVVPPDFVSGLSRSVGSSTSNLTNGNNSSKGSGAGKFKRKIAGSGSNSSKGVGTLRTLIQVNGRGDSSSQGAGAAKVTKKLAGNGAAASTSTASMGVRVELAGFGNHSNAGEGGLKVTKALDGSGDNSANGDGSLLINVEIAGNGDNSADGDGSLTVFVEIIGDGDNSSDGNGLGSFTKGLDGAASGSNDGNGALSVIVEFQTGDGNISSAGSGGIDVIVEISGDGVAASEGVGDLVVARALDGSGAGASGGTGSVDVVVELDGPGTAATTGNGVLAPLRGLSGEGEGAAEGAGVAKLTLGLSGSGPSSSTGTSSLVVSVELDADNSTPSSSSVGLGSIRRQVIITGEGDNSSSGSGVAIVSIQLQGFGSGSSTGTGSVPLGLLLRGEGDSSVTGTATLVSILGFDGVGSNTSTGSSSVIIIPPTDINRIPRDYIEVGRDYETGERDYVEKSRVYNGVVVDRSKMARDYK